MARMTEVGVAAQGRDLGSPDVKLPIKAPPERLSGPTEYARV